MDWQKQLETDMGFAETWLRTHGQLMPQFLVHARNGKVHVVAGDVSSDERVRVTAAIVRHMAIAHDAIAVSQMGEMWARFMHPYDRESDADYMARVAAVRPRDAEDRCEVVICQIYYRDETDTPRELSQTREIVRDADGKITGLALRDTEVLESEGPMTHLMPEHRPSAEAQRYSRDILKRHRMWAE